MSDKNECSWRIDRVNFGRPRELVGQIIPVRLTGLREDGEARGEIALSAEALTARVAAAPRRTEPEYLPLAMATE